MTIRANRFRAWCEDEEIVVYDWTDTEMVCPNDAEHTLTPSSIFISECAVHNPGEPFKISALLSPADAEKDVRTVNYKSEFPGGNLYRQVTTVTNGQYLQVDYCTDEACTDLVLRVRIYSDAALTTLGYQRNALTNLAEKRWTKREWYREDDTVGATKVTCKLYNNPNSEERLDMKEGRRRRTNVIDALEISVLNLIVATTAVDPQNPTQAEIDNATALGNAFLELFSTRISTYIRGGDLTWKDTGTPNLTDDDTDWLDNDLEFLGYPPGTTIRDTMLAVLVDVT